MVSELQNTSEEWTVALAAKNTRKLNELANTWLGLNITPAEFRRVRYLGQRTMQSAIADLGDANFCMKLSKVCLLTSPCSIIPTFSFVIICLFIYRFIYLLMKNLVFYPKSICVYRSECR